ncbi:MAG TPA: peptidylprolyl isomerase [Gammaproteobacteria bacterium]|nr:peptidylprolyl isomerase [Gammaproteobacteria bacterium]
MKAKLQTSLGDILIELYPDKAPLTVRNFIDYVNAGHYDGTIFHRVIDGFMIQGGGYLPGLKQKNTRPPVQNEANNGLSNKSGTIAMARTNDPHSASAQFFINVNDNPFLDHKATTAQGWGYCVFGRVVTGMDVVNEIKEVDTGHKGGMADVPREDVVINKASIEKA